MSKIAVISLHRPWSFWVELGWKTIETRTDSRLKSLRGRRIAIHHAQKWCGRAIDAARPFLTREQIEQTEQELRDKPGGYVSFTVKVYDAHWIHPDSASQKAALIECKSMARFGLWLTDIQLVEPVKIKGKQGIWYIDSTLLRGKTPGAAPASVGSPAESSVIRTSDGRKEF